MKKFRVILLCLILLPCLLFIPACTFSKDKHIVNIVKTSDYTYTITYSDGTTDTINTNGKNGADLTIENIKAYCEQKGLDFEKFLKDNFSVDTDLTTSATAKASKSAVSIVSLFEKGSSTLTSGGAGVIYKMADDYSYIITNYHVVYYNQASTDNNISDEIYIFQYGMEQVTNSEIYEKGISCEYIGGSMTYDIAVLRVETNKLHANARAVDIADGYELAETAIAIGNPNNNGISVTSGIVSVVSEDITMKGADELTTINFRVLRIDTAINGGNSGGGLFNHFGELIGIVNAKYVNDQIDNIAYALPYDNVIKVADNLIHYYETTGSESRLKTLVFNITYDFINSHAVYEGDSVKIVEDLKLVDITPDKLGDTLGLQSNDIVKSMTVIRGEQSKTYNFERSFELKELCLTIRAGDKISLQINRQGNLINTNEFTITDAELKSVI